MPIFATDKKEYFLPELLCDAKLVSSKNEAKRLVEAGAVQEMKITNVADISFEKITDWKEDIEVWDGMVIKVGNRKFVKIKLQ